VSEDIHAIGQLLKAYALYERDRHYVVVENKVKIVDENTGRIMEGRRWNDGLHQAVETKENVPLEKENKTYATITIQNYFRMYEKLAGMTGTAETEASEFNDIYRLSVVTIPTHRPCIRVDDNDIVFKTRREKYAFAIKEIADAHSRGQPVLVGTASVEASETLSRMLGMAKVPHKVLNAKHHEQEAEIVSSRASWRGDHRDEHGRPRHRYPAGRGRTRARRPLRARHRAPRIPPRRPPAARPLLPPGRPGPLPLPHRAGGRPDASVLQRGHHLLPPREVLQGRRTAGAPAAQPLDRHRPEARRGPELLDAQAAAAVRRRAEPPAPDRLRLRNRTLAARDSREAVRDVLAEEIEERLAQAYPEGATAPTAQVSTPSRAGTPVASTCGSRPPTCRVVRRPSAAEFALRKRDGPARQPRGP
jgi:hypothetical protein